MPIGDYGRTEGFWWDQEPNAVYMTLVKQYEVLRDEQHYVHDSNFTHLRLYSNRLAVQYGGLEHNIPNDGRKLKLNLARAVVDAATAQIGTERPRPLFLTRGGDYSLKRKGKLLTQFFLGQYIHQQHYKRGLRVFEDGGIFGTGFLKITADPHRPCIIEERVFPDEIVVDEQEAKYAPPQVMYQHKEVDKRKLLKLYPEFKAQIHAAKMVRGREEHSRYSKNRCSLIESWLLPSSPDAGDGRHVICLTSCDLLDEPWERDHFPIVGWRWQEPALGFLGMGLVESVISPQTEINYLLERIQESMTLATTFWMKDRQSFFNSEQFSNEPWAWYDVEGQAPRPVVMQPIHPDYYQQVWNIYDRTFQEVGVSQLFASAQKPAGLNSGQALRVYNDTTSRRFKAVQQRWEDFHAVECARLYIEAAKEISERGDGGIEIMAYDKRNREVNLIRWDEVALEEDKYIINPYPASLLPDEPAGRLQTIREFAEISPEAQRYLMDQLDYPDIQEFLDHVNGPVRLIDRMFEEILENGRKDLEPDPLLDLDMLVDRGILAIHSAELNRVPAPKLDLLREFVSKAYQKQLQMQAMAAPPTMPVPQAPGAEMQMGPVAPGAITQPM